MDTYQKFLEIEKKLESSLKGLNINSQSIAKFIMKNPDKSPLPLVYKTSAGQIESDDQIREDLSTLIGYEISYEDLNEKRVTVVILFESITKDMLEAEGCLTNPTVGKLREIAKTIHSEAKIIDEWIAACMWYKAADYYTIRFLLGEKGIEIPDIQTLSSSEEHDSNSSISINWNSSCGRWEYLDGVGGFGVINWNLPVWCYYVKE